MAGQVLLYLRGGVLVAQFSSSASVVIMDEAVPTSCTEVRHYSRHIKSCHCNLPGSTNKLSCASCRVLITLRNASTPALNSS